MSLAAPAPHVVLRAKEALVLRPHGHILRGGSWYDNPVYSRSAFRGGLMRYAKSLG